MPTSCTAPQREVLYDTAIIVVVTGGAAIIGPVAAGAAGGATYLYLKAVDGEQTVSEVIKGATEDVQKGYYDRFKDFIAKWLRYIAILFVVGLLWIYRKEVKIWFLNLKTKKWSRSTYRRLNKIARKIRKHPAKK
jgi:hypothetical protein